MWVLTLMQFVGSHDAPPHYNGHGLSWVPPKRKASDFQDRVDLLVYKSTNRNCDIIIISMYLTLLQQLCLILS